MTIAIDNRSYDLLPSPSWGNYVPTRKAPKIKFQATAGYSHQRERWPSARYSYPLEWALLTVSETNMLEDWIEYIGSSTFYFVPPESLWPRGADGSVAPIIRLGRIVDDEIAIKPVAYGFFTAKLTIEEV